MDSGVDSFGFDAPAHLRAGSGKPPRDGDLIKAMVAGRVGSRPDMRAEFTEFANALHTAEGSDSSCFSQTPEVGVLAMDLHEHELAPTCHNSLPEYFSVVK